MPRPQPPDGTARIVAHVDVHEVSCTVGFWLLIPGADLADFDYAHTLLNQFFLFPVTNIVALMHSGASITACSVTIYTPARPIVAQEFVFGTGPWEGGQATNVALGWHWLGSTHGRGRTSVNRLTAVPDVFINNNWRLSEVGYANLRDQQAAFITAMNALPAPVLGSSCTLGCVHNLAPGSSSAPFFDPFSGGYPSRRVLTIGRRLPRTDRVSP